MEKLGGIPLLIRWTEDWDCPNKTEFWYCIKDTAFNIEKLKSKRRYEIKKGVKNFDINKIDPTVYGEEIYRVAVEAFAAYPEVYRPRFTKEEFLSGLKAWSNSDVFGAFNKGTNELVGYAQLEMGKRAINFFVEKSMPQYEKAGINAAIVYSIVKYYEPYLKKGYYIVDGTRAINHDTHFQDYLEKYFGFRKAYCTLHVKYRSWIYMVVLLLRPFQKFIANSKNPLAHQVSSVLKMEWWREHKSIK